MIIRRHKKTQIKDYLPRILESRNLKKAEERLGGKSQLQAFFLLLCSGGDEASFTSLRKGFTYHNNSNPFKIEELWVRDELGKLARAKDEPLTKLVSDSWNLIRPDKEKESWTVSKFDAFLKDSIYPAFTIKTTSRKGMEIVIEIMEEMHKLKEQESS